MTAQRDMSELAILRDRAEAAVYACLAILPLVGSVCSGYQVSEHIDSVVAATPEEWADAANAIAELHTALEAGNRG